MKHPPKALTCTLLYPQIQIGCQTDRLNASELKRAPCVHVRFPVNSEMIQVSNLWGGLIYLVAPSNTQAQGLEAFVQIAVPAPYYKSGECGGKNYGMPKPKTILM